MDIQTADRKFHHINYGDSSFNELSDELIRTADQEQHHLSLFLGLYQPNKKRALDELADKLDRKVKVIDTGTLISKIESITFANLDTLFEGLDQSNVILYFINGGRLCGTYTGYSLSRVKYATPQERYFLKKVKHFNGMVVVDIEEFTYAVKTLRLACQATSHFYLPP